MLVYKYYQGKEIGAFQTKTHYKYPSNTTLITNSCIKLFEYIALARLQRVDLNFPGIENGKLNREDVLPIISLLPDVVHIWELS
jgi:hypothetical protein